MKKIKLDKNKLGFLFFLLILIILISVLSFFELNINKIFLNSTIKSLSDKSDFNATIIETKIQEELQESGKQISSSFVKKENENMLYFDDNSYISNKLLNNVFSKSSFDQTEYIFVIDHYGNIFYASNSDYKLCYYENLFDFFMNVNYTSTKKIDLIQKDFINQECGNFIYKINEQERICCYSPIICNGWYVLTVVPISYVNSQQKNISAIFFIIIIINIFAFIVTYIILKHNFKNIDFFDISKQKKSSNYKQNQSLLMEFDFENDIIEMTGESEFIFGRKIHKTSISDFHTYLSNIHPDDYILIENIKKFIKNQGFNYTAELRYKCSDSKYYWFHMNSSNIFNKEGNNIKYIVHLVNVNSRKNLDNLHTMNKNCDELTGLLNAESFEFQVHNFLNKTKNKSTSALFLIDLDDLKKINIKLGHHFGDICIKNSATNISLVFSQKDIIGRIKGNKFGILLCLNKQLSEEKAFSIINEKAQILGNILSLSYSDNQRNVRISASIGISIYPFHGQNYSELIKSAESTLYSVKQNGKNGYKIYSQTNKKNN